MKYTIRVVVVAEPADTPAPGFSHKTVEEAVEVQWDVPCIMLMSAALQTADTYEEACLKAGTATAKVHFSGP